MARLAGAGRERSARDALTEGQAAAIRRRRRFAREGRAGDVPPPPAIHRAVNDEEDVEQELRRACPMAGGPRASRGGAR